MDLPASTLLHGTLSALGLAATLLPVFKTRSKWVRFFDFPRLQIAFLLTVLLGTVWWGYQDETLVLSISAALILALVYQLYWILPFTPLARREVQTAEEPDPNRTFRLLIFNVRMENRRYEAFLKQVQAADPDLILANEVDDAWVQAIDFITKEYPYQVLQPQENTYGMALYSRLELAQAEVRFQVQDDIPSIQCLVILKDGSAFHFHGIHPKPPDLQTDTEARDAELVLTGIRIKKEHLPSLIAGDLNDVAWSYTTRLFKRLSGMLDPRLGRGFYNTYNVFIPLFRYPLDHLFITGHFRLVRLKRLPACGSDHYPMLAELEFIPEKQHEQPVEAADHADHEEASEILADARESEETRL